MLPLTFALAGAADYTGPKDELTLAQSPVRTWDGPVSGPPGARDKTIVYLSGDLRNGGILGVATGLREAARILGWKVKIIDLRWENREARVRAVEETIKLRADAVVIAGFDAMASVEELRPLAARKIPILGWHAGPSPGPIPGTPVVLNVSTDPLKVARVAAGFVTTEKRTGRAGVVIFTDTRFGIAKAKSDAMKVIVENAPNCDLLEVCDVHIDAAAKEMPKTTRRLLDKHGAKWTHALAINDLYFDHATPTFAVEGMAPEAGVACVSAGDGSVSAYVRIQAGLYQTATVAEPLNLQGWQLADEMNRIFSGAPTSGYITPVHLVNAGNIDFDGGPKRRFDPDNRYGEAYRKIWRR